MILFVVGLLVLAVAGYLYIGSRSETVSIIGRALVWKALSVALSDSEEVTAETVTTSIQLYSKDMEILRNLGLGQFLFSNIPSLLSAEAQKAINEYALAINSVNVK